MFTISGVPYFFSEVEAGSVGEYIKTQNIRNAVERMISSILIVHLSENNMPFWINNARNNYKFKIQAINECNN